MNAVKLIIFSLLALAIGFFALSLFFGDLGPGETMGGRIAMAAAIYFVAGLIFGFFNPRAWLLAGLVSWGGVVMGLAGLFIGEDIGLSLLSLASSLGSALLGGLLGSFAARRKRG